jgi:hypothetical protein
MLGELNEVVFLVACDFLDYIVLFKQTILTVTCVAPTVAFLMIPAIGLPVTSFPSRKRENDFRNIPHRKIRHFNRALEYALLAVDCS